MAENYFLSNKFTLASLPENVMPRTELLPLYDEAAKAVNTRFVYVSAPAGSGKKVSALLWLEHSGREAVWIGLDKYDSVPSVFFKQLSIGLFSTQQKNEAMLGILSNPAFSSSPIENIIALINEMYPDDTPRALVLDDLHLIKNNEIFKAMPYIIKRLPANFVVIILSRFAPPPEFMPLIGKLIGSQFLRFSQNEIMDYFQKSGQTLTVKQSREVFNMTEGWVMGVNAVIHSGNSGINTGEGVHGFDFSGYFETQIWGQWTPDLRKFCLDTAVLDEFSPALAAIMTEREDCAEILEELSLTNSFLSRIHDDYYRYHHIFQDFLRRKLHGNKRAPLLNKRAAEYYREQGDYTRALRYMINSGDWKSIDGYLLLFLFKNRRGGISDYADFLRGFFEDDFPKKAYSEMPALHVLAAWYYYITGQHEKFAFHMDSILKKLPQVAKAGNEFVEFSILAFSVDHRKTMKQKAKAYGIFKGLLKKYTPEGLATTIASYTHSLPIVARSNVDYNEFALDPEWITFLEKSFAPLLGSEWEYLPSLLAATFAYERARFADALALLSECETLIKPSHKIDGRICAAFLHHAILSQMGKPKMLEAEKAFEDLRNLVDIEAPDFLPNLKAYITKMRLWGGEKDAIKEWLDEYFVLDVERIELFKLFQHFTTARVYIAAGEYEEAEKLLTLLADYGKNLRRPIDEAEALTLFSVYYSAIGNKNSAESYLFAALEILSDYNYIMVVADEGAAVEPMLKKILNKVSAAGYSVKLTRNYVNEVLLCAHAKAKQYPRYKIGKQDKNDADIKLSRRQRDTLKLVAQGYHASEICSITGLTLSTVKSHLYFAYKKLGVNDSLDAVVKARELGLI
jgi:LuxR family maltose regulon positive regulatory protein